MVKIFLVIQLLIVLAEQSLSLNNSELVHKKVCGSFVSLDQKQYVIKGRNDETINCYIESVNECVFNEHKVFIKLMVNNVSYDFGSLDCKRQTFDLQQAKCHMKILFGIEDLKATDSIANQFNITCIASFNTKDGVIEGESSYSSLKVFRGELLYSSCSDTKPCISDRNITCTQNLCSCKSNEFVTYIDDNGITSCAPPVKHNEQCLNDQQCNNDYSAQCSQTSIGKLCECRDNYYWDGMQCKYGVDLQRSSCPSCYCNQDSCVNEWTFKLNVMIFMCGMIAGIFALKTCMCCIKKKISNESYVIERQEPKLSSLTLDPKELGKQFSENLNHKFESLKSNDKSEDLEAIKVKY